MPTPPVVHPHGSYGRYKAGCRCDECRAANAVYSAEYRQRKAMGELLVAVLSSPDNEPGERRGRRGLNKPAGPSSQGWSRADRAPGLRRIADRLDREARQTKDVARKVKLQGLACKMRLRATAIELAGLPPDEMEDTVRVMQTASAIELT